MGLRELVFLCIVAAAALLLTALVLYAKFRHRPVLTAVVGNLCFVGAGVLVVLSLMLGYFVQG